MKVCTMIWLPCGAEDWWNPILVALLGLGIAVVILSKWPSCSKISAPAKIDERTSYPPPRFEKQVDVVIEEKGMYHAPQRQAEQAAVAWEEKCSAWEEKCSAWMVKCSAWEEKCRELEKRLARETASFEGMPTIPLVATEAAAERVTEQPPAEPLSCEKWGAKSHGDVVEAVGIARHVGRGAVEQEWQEERRAQEREMLTAKCKEASSSSRRRPRWAY
jgi:hypothetical protein